MTKTGAFLAAGCLALLTACGGGGGSSGSNDNDGGTAVVNTQDFGPIDQALIDTSAACDAGAGTSIAGGNVQGNWTVAGSPYIISGDITIISGTTLIIDPGVVVCVADSDMMGAGLDAARVEITVIGSLDIEGTAAMPIVVRSVDVSNAGGNWYGIVIDPTVFEINVDYVYLKNAQYGFLAQQVFAMDNTVLQHNTEGIRAQAAVTVFKSVLVNNTYGLRVMNPGDLFVSSSLLFANDYGIYSASAANSNVIHNNTIDRNAIDGIRIVSTAAAAAHSLRNNIVTGNGAYGIYRENTTGSVVSDYSNVWSNGTADYFQVTPGPGSLSADPLYVAAPVDYRLRATSVSIDSGSASGIALDLIGTARPLDFLGGGAVYDMGAYENIP